MFLAIYMTCKKHLQKWSEGGAKPRGLAVSIPSNSSDFRKHYKD